MIPFSNTTCSAVAAANAAGDEVATLLYGIAVAAVLAECEAAHVAADQPPLMLILDEDRAEALYARMKEYSAANPDATLRTAVETAYNATRAAMMLRPRMH